MGQLQRVGSSFGTGHATEIFPALLEVSNMRRHVVASATMMSITIPRAQANSAVVQIVPAAWTAGREWWRSNVAPVQFGNARKLGPPVSTASEARLL